MIDLNKANIDGHLYENVVTHAAYILEEVSFLYQYLDYEDISMVPGVDAKTPLYGKPNAAKKIVNGVDLSTSTNGAISSLTDVVISTDEYGSQVFTTRLAQMAASQNLADDAAEQIGIALGVSRDKVITDLFKATGSGALTESGTTSAALAVSHIIEAAAELRSNAVPISGEVVAVLHPKQLTNIKESLLNAGGTFGASPMAADNAAMNYETRQLAGVRIIESANVDVNTTTNIATGAIFHRKAMKFVSKIPFTIETEWDSSRRGVEFNGSAVFGAGTIDPLKARKLSSSIA